MAKHNMASLSIAHSSPSSSFCTKDVLIIVSSVTQQRDKELIAQEVCYRSQGTLTHLDKQFLRESRIPCDQWQNEARILEAQFHKGKELYNVVEVLDDPEMGASAVLKKITDLCRSTRKFGILIWYCGPSRRYHGDWCLKHGFITWQHIVQIYKEYFAGKIMTVVSDCSYSGQWTMQWTQHLEERKIKPCIHSSLKQKTYLSLISSCSGFEKASKLLMAVRGFYRSLSGTNAVRQYNSRIDTGQHSHCCITTMKTCASDFNSPCSLPSDYSWSRKKFDENVYLMRSRTFSEWAIVVVHGPSEDVNDRIKSGHIEDLKEYGDRHVRILYSGSDRSPSLENIVKFNVKFPMNRIKINL